MLKLDVARVADALAMTATAIVLAACNGDAADANNAGAAQAVVSEMPATRVATQAELHHFDVYNSYRALFDAPPGQMRKSMPEGVNGAAAASFSGCSLRALLVEDWME